MADFNKVGLLAIRDNCFLVCRKKDFTSKLIMPGGSIELGETVLECLIREINEELGNKVHLEDIQYYGTYFDKAASDDPTINKTVEIQLFKGIIIGSPIASSEIAELIWFNEHANRNDLSAIIQNKILPDLVANKDLNWE